MWPVVVPLVRTTMLRLHTLQMAFTLLLLDRLIAWRASVLTGDSLIPATLALADACLVVGE